MENITPEEEFKARKALHKYSVLMARMMKYYADLQGTGTNIPAFMRDDTPEALAKRDIQKLLIRSDGGEKFNRLYEMAWEEIAPVLD